MLFYALNLFIIYLSLNCESLFRNKHLYGDAYQLFVIQNRALSALLRIVWNDQLRENRLIFFFAGRAYLMFKRSVRHLCFTRMTVTALPPVAIHWKARDAGWRNYVLFKIPLCYQLRICCRKVVISRHHASFRTNRTFRSVNSRKNDRFPFISAGMALPPYVQSWFIVDLVRWQRMISGWPFFW